MAWFRFLGFGSKHSRQDDIIEEDAELEDDMQWHQELLDEYSSEVPKLGNMLSDVRTRLDEAVEKEDGEWQQLIYDDIMERLYQVTRVCTYERAMVKGIAAIKANLSVVAQQPHQPGVLAVPQ